MVEPKYVLTISGSDSSGYAGMQADNRAILSTGAFPLNVITALTVQTTEGVEAVELMTAEFVEQQLRRLLAGYPVASIKIGMLGTPGIVEVVACALADYPEIPCALDPVLVASSGRSLSEPGAVSLLREQLMPRAILTTPNLSELYVLAGVAEGAPALATALHLAEEVGQSVLLKGGHCGGAQCEDWLVGADGSRELFSAERVSTRNLRGTGCVLSSLIAARLAGGEDVSTAVMRAKRSLEASLRKSSEVVWCGDGPSFV